MANYLVISETQMFWGNRPVLNLKLYQLLGRQHLAALKRGNMLGDREGIALLCLDDLHSESFLERPFVFQSACSGGPC